MAFGMPTAGCNHAAPGRTGQRGADVTISQWQWEKSERLDSTLEALHGVYEQRDKQLFGLTTTTTVEVAEVVRGVAKAGNSIVCSTKTKA